MKKDDLLDRILSDLEKDKLRAIADDDVALDALKKLLLTPVYYNGTLEAGQPADPTRNFVLSITNRTDLTDEQLGQATRARADAVAMLENAFSILATFESEDPTPERSELNEAR